MDSYLWRVSTEKVGKLEPFGSEADMESFLMNNFAVIGCAISDKQSDIPLLVRQQLGTKTQTGRGRLDIIGLSREGDAFELRLFELTGC
jgi:hypothetical protein